jgi:sugar phosphate isomerase/epimerase
MYLTGFSDEAGGDINVQIKATKELGWSNIELRRTGFKGDMATMSDEDFETMSGLLNDAGVTINCFGSGIANWGQAIDAPFENTLNTVKASIPRMQKLGTSLVRIMSYAILRDEETWVPLADQNFEERARRLNEIVPMFLDAGITPVHENCMNYGGLCWQNSLRLMEAVPKLKLVFDTGNPVFSPDAAKPAENGVLPRQNAWEFYTNVKPFIEYVHIKDGRGVATDGHGQIFPGGQDFTYPGEGDCMVPEIIKDLCDSGYDGGFSMEPHLSVVFHEEGGETQAGAQYNSYIEYGKKFMTIARDAGYSC